MKLVEPFRNSQKEYDPELEICYHESGHALIQVSYGLVSRYTSVIAFKDRKGFASNAFFACYDVGVDWETEALKYELMHLFAGIVSAAYYTGKYNLNMARGDMEKAEQIRLSYDLPFREYLGIWYDTHALIKEYSDLLEKAAEALHRDRVLGAEFWEEEILLTRK